MLSKIRVMLVSIPGKARQAYTELLNNIGVDYDVVDNFSHIKRDYNQVKYNGFLIDVATIVRSGSREKVEANHLIERFPVLRVNYHSSGGSIKGLPFGKFSGDGMTVEEFINTECNSFPSRSLRGSKRISKKLNILLLRSESQPRGTGEKSITTDLSADSAFLYSTSPWEEGEKVWLIVKELSDHTPIESIIQRVVPWGVKNEFPGIAVRFLEMSSKQSEEFAMMF
jgi:hypothetical protein